MMQHRIRKRICLNLALILLLCLAPLPVHAADAYTITVGSVVFYSDTDRQGSGWRYDAASHALYLNGYSGREIAASGDLTVYLNGRNYVSAGNLSVYSAPAGITADGTLEIYLESGETSVHGGNSKNDTGGDGITADAVYLHCHSETACTMNIYAGDARSSSSGGNGIYAGNIDLDAPQGNLMICGGNSVDGVGGTGLRATSGTAVMQRGSVVQGGSGGAGGGKNAAGELLICTRDLASGKVTAAVTGAAGGAAVTVVAAVYDANGKMLGLGSQTQSLTAQESVSVSIPIAVGATRQPASCRAFLLNTATCAPLSAPLHCRLDR